MFAALALPALDLTLLLLTSKQQHLDLIPLRLTNDWSFDPRQAIRLPGAHGEEIVRSIHVHNEVSVYEGVDVPCLIDRPNRTGLFSPRARTVL